MTAYFSKKSGRPFNYPPGKEEAIERGSHLYSDEGGGCIYCGGSETPRYVVDDTCVRCLIHGADCPVTGDHFPGYNDLRLTIDWDKYTLRPKVCKGGPHLVKWYKGTNKCATCDDIREARGPSPRQAAIAANETWYMPDSGCVKCGTIALKRVYDGKCQGCKPVSSVDGRTRDNPLPTDTVMDRETARSLGFKHYRTGNACGKGHTDFRYVSTGQCLECRRVGR